MGRDSIFHSSDGIPDKPIFLVDGFDPNDTRNIEEFMLNLTMVVEIG